MAKKKNPESNVINVVINGKSVLGKVDGVKDRAKTSLYLSQSLLKRFKMALGERSASRTIEVLLEEFLLTVEE